MKNFILALGLCVFAAPVLAVLPDEVLTDANLEARARALSKELRCLVCRNENIDSSNAGIARDLRLLVRERLSAGDTDAQAMDFIVDRYGEYVLLKPRFNRANGILYLVGPLALLFGAGACVAYIQRREQKPGVEPLSKEDQNRVAELLKD